MPIPDKKQMEIPIEQLQMWKWIPPWIPVWDPPPPWLKLNDTMVRQFAQMEIQFKMKELELQKQKLQEFGKIMGIG